MIILKNLSAIIFKKSVYIYIYILLYIFNIVMYANNAIDTQVFGYFELIDYSIISNSFISNQVLLEFISYLKLLLLLLLLCYFFILYIYNFLYYRIYICCITKDPEGSTSCIRQRSQGKEFFIYQW